MNNAAMIVIVVCAILAITAMIINRYFPFLLGRRRLNAKHE